MVSYAICSNKCPFTKLVGYLLMNGFDFYTHDVIRGRHLGGGFKLILKKSDRLRFKWKPYCFISVANQIFLKVN